MILRTHSRSSIAPRVAIIAALGATTTAHAALDSALLSFPTSYTNQIETDAAIATQNIYNQLVQRGCSNDPTTGAVVNCPNAQVAEVFKFVSEVTINAENILNGQATLPGTLGRPNQLLLGRALQWCSGEEFTSTGSQASAFTGGQIANLATRLSGLRFGTAGPVRIASNPVLQFGGGASADGLGSDWSGYVNGDYLNGGHKLTTHENPFDLSNTNITAGMDKRLNNQWVAGGMVGYQKQKLVFTDATKGVNVVDGASKSTGWSAMPYALYQNDNWYFNLSLGYQKQKFDLSRDVNYGSPPASGLGIVYLNTNTSDVTATGWSSYDSVGYTWRPVAGLSIEPSLSADWRHITVGSFTEQEAIAKGTGGFNFKVDEQHINSLEMIPALRLQYTLTPGFAVITPYLDAQWHRQVRDQSRTIHAVYADIADLVTDDAKFSIHTDKPDDSYQVYTAGVSAVLSGTSRGGLQVYGNYRWYHQLDNYSLHSISAGLRYEF